MLRPIALLGALLAGLLLAGCGGPGAGPRPQVDQAGIGRYVALGDSYSSAPGVPQQVDDRCLRSDHNYPSLVANELRPGTFVDRSCGGATTADMVQSQMPGVSPQFDALTADTDLVTVGIGGNDLGLFRTMIGRCVLLSSREPGGAPCTEAARRLDPHAVRRVTTGIRTNVAKVLSGIAQRSPSATVVAVGYPQLVPATGSCAELPLATGDYPFARRLNKGLDDAVRDAARDAGVRFADVWHASAGHTICSRTPWINGVHDAAGRAAPFHPFEAEQQAVARLVARAVRHPASESAAP